MNVYEKIAQHLTEQKAQALNDNYGGCMYRTEEGLKCAVGCLVPDDIYDPLLEGEIINEKNHAVLSAIDPQWRSDPLFSIEALRDIQRYHDTNVQDAGGSPYDFSYKRWLEGSVDDHPVLAIRMILKHHGITSTNGTSLLVDATPI